MATVESGLTSNFITDIIDHDLSIGRNDGAVVTRFPPEPNGYLHIGHATAICLNFEIARHYADRATGGTRCHLRFDDTNPIKEEQRYIDAIKDDIRWLGLDWGEHEYYASDYFEQLYQWAVKLINDGRAFVCDLSAEQIRETRGTLTEPGVNSPFRDRSIDENLDLFARMRAGEFPDGTRTLRAKIDMAASNLNLRDPVMYRILHAHHHRTGDAWCIYPMYDFAHGQGDSIEGVTHSLCSLEFANHRPLYDWFCENLGIHHPQQIEFARRNMTHTLTSKRRLLQLVDEGHVDAWDDPRMPTVSAMRRRGYPPRAIREFCNRIGVAKRENVVETALLEHCVREELNRTAPRVMAVLRPLKVVITNYPDQPIPDLEAVNNPEDESAGTRPVSFTRELYIERDDFMIDPPKKYFRLGPGREVRLRYGYFVTCTDYKVDDATGEVVEVHCTYDPETRGGNAPDGRKVKGTIHWVSAEHAVDAQVRLYDQLFAAAEPNRVEEGKSFLDNLNPHSLEVVEHAKLEPALADARPGAQFQFERLGYFCVDTKNSEPGRPVFNRAVTLRDTWGKQQQKDNA
jgi:glutaminyl-tRNA synthetase